MSFKIDLPKNIESIITDGSFVLHKVESGIQNLCILTYIDGNLRLIVKFLPKSLSLYNCEFFYKEQRIVLIDTHQRQSNRVRQIEDSTIVGLVSSLRIKIREFKFKDMLDGGV